MKYNFKIRFNTEYQKTPDKCWRALINDVEHLVSDIQIDNIQVKTLSHIIASGEQKWSVYCEANNYEIDNNFKLFIF